MEQKEEVPMKITSSEMLQKAGIPLIAQVLVTGRGELVTNFDRSYSLEHYNKVMIDYDGGNCLYVTAEEYTEILLADKLGDAYQPKQWLYGFYWKISDDADFSKVGLEPTLDYNLSNGSTIPYPRHMPVGGYMCLHPTFGYITVEEMNLVRQLQSDKHDNVADSSLHLSSLGAPNPSVVSQNHIKVFAQSGEKPIQLTEVTIDSIERLAQFYRMLPHGHEVPPLSTTMHDVYDDVNGLFQIVDTSVVPDLIKTEWVDNKWLTWSPDKAAHRDFKEMHTISDSSYQCDCYQKQIKMSYIDIYCFKLEQSSNFSYVQESYSQGVTRQLCNGERYGANQPFSSVY
jgi:hypothetical protein